MHHTNQPKQPPERTKPPRQHASKHTEVPHRRRRLTAQEHAPVVVRERPIQHHLPQCHQRESALRERPADDQVLVDLVRRRLALVVLEEDDGRERNCEGHPYADLEERDDDGWDAESVAEVC